MSGIVHSLLVLAGLRTPRRPPSARLRVKTAPARPAGKAMAKPAGKASAPGSKPAARPSGAAGTVTRKPPSRAPASRGGNTRQAKPAGPPGRNGGSAGARPVPGRSGQQGARPRVGTHGHDAIDALDEIFSDVTPAAPRPQGLPRPKAAAAAVTPARSRTGRSVSGLGMFLLAGTCLTLGGWLGSQVQAYAYGATAATFEDMSAMKSFDPSAGLRY